MNYPPEFFAIPNTAILNDAGEVAMKYGNQQRILVRCGQYDYVFMMRANISMSWVKPEDVPCVRKVKGGCCGKKKPGVIVFANESDARRWTAGGGR